MAEGLHQEALTKLKDTFGDRIQPPPERDTDSEGSVASVMPRNTEEIQLLSEVARRYSIPLIPLGAGTSTDTVEEQGSLLVRFDLMRRRRLPDGEAPWIEVEPGVPWLELEDELRIRGRGLAVYPTSAPRATVGGWLATDGFGVGSFEYGWLSENVLSVGVVLPGGELREVRGTDLQSFIHTTEDTAIVVSAKLRTRVANTDTPCAVAFEDPNALLGAVTDTVEASVPLWHLAFLNPMMAWARGLGENHLLFGAYPRERSDEVEEEVRRIAELHEGNVLPAADTHRVWTERFFPAAPAHPTPNADRTFVPISQLPMLLADDRVSENTALQGTVSRSKEVLLLTYDSDT